ncbi:type II toxin-antitoxin system RelE/ParE family toxin [Sphingomonas floccifaciens]|uniref:Type II toxin-antitoxin system RelE/ParE family toxin n=1 Tax=Sphingomonas floccifaciens TaxID=1844115 RepID=A0ABW4NE21_9SPHN
MRFDWAPAATRDARETWLYIAADNPVAADAWLDRILDAWAGLVERPGIGTPQDKLFPGLRSRTIGKYRMFYATVDGRVELLRIIHGARDLSDVSFD